MINYKVRSLELAEVVVDLAKTGDPDLMELARQQAMTILDAQKLDDEAREFLSQHNLSSDRTESEELFDKYLAKVREANRILGSPVQLNLFMRGD